MMSLIDELSSEYTRSSLLFSVTQKKRNTQKKRKEERTNADVPPRKRFTRIDRLIVL